MSGLFGVISKGDCLKDLFYGTDYHSHMGTEYGGVAVLGESFNRQIHNISQTQFKSKFYEDYKHMEGDKGIGVISDFDEQPIYLNSKFGPFCIVTAGLIDNRDKLVEKLLQEGVTFSEVTKGGVNTAELIAKLISQGDDLIDGIEKMFNRIEGSCSLLLLTKDGIYAARDRRGYTPLAIGKKDSAYAITSETSAFPNLGFKIVKYVQPGEIVLVDQKGMHEKKSGLKDNQICTFLWIYTGFPASTYEGINTEVVREECGKRLARRDKDIEVDLVSGVPDSGVAHAIGYAIESGKPYRRPLVKYTPGYGRSYTPPSQETRDLIAKMKLIPIKDIIKGNRIVVCEDSIVRGTQLKNFTVKKLWEAGAKEVHARPACPPLMFPCKFCLSTRSFDELAARKAIKAIEGKEVEDISEYLDSNSSKYAKMVAWIAKDLEVTTLRYQTIEDLIEAVGLPKEKLCLYCWKGDFCQK
ncbi:MAG: amidophosphoribosyltransferase [Candidatus Omnitrophica bacterium]|nr:amidophosphoribosyltransferase [Candidatus Omnitrophota bacterium]MBU2044761.1 amidophosphoribosyltransferase [Candidatus Omnitrophota bacterium]MBU2251623.1 amidophosphoribosyltransferase [Candidatus Omnitrophota bacterium]MBU2473894.1 amidophosphoribosyltransferase [Candidatus Omnitrophota bacterium]